MLRTGHGYCGVSWGACGSAGGALVQGARPPSRSESRRFVLKSPQREALACATSGHRPPRPILLLVPLVDHQKPLGESPGSEKQKVEPRKRRRSGRRANLRSNKKHMHVLPGQCDGQPRWSDRMKVSCRFLNFRLVNSGDQRRVKLWLAHFQSLTWLWQIKCARKASARGWWFSAPADHFTPVCPWIIFRWLVSNRIRILAQTQRSVLEFGWMIRKVVLLNIIDSSTSSQHHQHFLHHQHPHHYPRYTHCIHHQHRPASSRACLGKVSPTSPASPAPYHWLC